MDYYWPFFFYIMLWLHLLHIIIIIYLYDQNWQLAGNMLLSSFPMYQSSLNRLITQRLPKAQKQKNTPPKRTTLLHTLQDNIEKKKKTSLRINHLIHHLNHFPTYPISFSPCYFRQIPLGHPHVLIKVYFSLLSLLRSASSLFFQTCLSCLG